MSEPFEIAMDLPGRNALDEASMDWIGARLDEADGRPVLLRGTRAAFCAGLNLKRVAQLGGAAMAAYLRRVDALVVRLFEYPGPTVALVEGHAIAGGCVLVQACDLRVALDDERLRIGLNEVALGACFPPVVLKLLAHRLPARWRETVLLGAELFPPRRALELGLVDIVDPDPERHAREGLARLASHPPATYASVKAGLRRGVLDLDPEDERRFREDEVPLWGSEELRARVRAALQR